MLLKILNVIPSLNPTHGGPVEGLRQHSLATEALCDRHVVCLDDPNAPYLEGFPATVHAIGNPVRWPSPLQHYGFNSTLIPWLRQNTNRFDAVITHGLWNYASFAASMVLPGGEVPYYSFTHGMMDPWFRRQYPLKHLAKQAFWLFAEGRLLAGAKRVFFTASEEAVLARGVFWGHGFKGDVVGYGTMAPPEVSETDIQTFRSLCPKLGNRPYILYLSRIHEKKGCDLLLQAFADLDCSLRDIDLVIAGPGDPAYVESLKDQASALGIGDRIHWPGMLSGGAKWGAYSGSEFFILPSHQENFGIVVAEALALGKVVIISNKVNIWREVESSGSGLVCNDTSAGVREAIRKWLSLSQSQRQAMAERSKVLFRDHYDVDVVAPAILESIKSDLAASSSLVAS